MDSWLSPAQGTLTPEIRRARRLFALAAADPALYRAKQAGRDRVCTLPLGACPSDPRHGCP